MIIPTVHFIGKEYHVTGFRPLGHDSACFNLHLSSDTHVYVRYSVRSGDRNNEIYSEAHKYWSYGPKDFTLLCVVFYFDASRSHFR